MYRNCTQAEVERELRDRGVGAVLIRPSSSDSATLVLNWKMSDSVVAQYAVEERRKACALTLGRELRIGRQAFGDLDELYATFVEPLNATARAVAHFRYFRRGSKAAIDALLAQAKQKEPRRTPYFVAVSDEHPGCYLLAFLPGRTPRHIYFRPGPGKLLLRGMEFASIEQLIAYFKDHADELVRPPPPPPPAHHARYDDDGYDDDGYDDRHRRHHRHHHRDSRSRSRSRSRSYSRSRSRSYSRSRSRSHSRERAQYDYGNNAYDPAWQPQRPGTAAMPYSAGPMPPQQMPYQPPMQQHHQQQQPQWGESSGW